jgi:AraC-like DNA-binding protein
MASATPSTNPGQEPKLKVWDTRDDSYPDPFECFREGTRTSGFPWLQELNEDRQFAARVERIEFEDGLIAQVESRPHVAVRNSRNVSQSSIEGYLVLYMLAGELSVEQGEQAKIARPGDLIVFDTTRPCKMFTEPMTPGQLSIALHHFGPMEGGPTSRSDLVLTRDSLAAPLATCFRFLSQNIRVASPSELQAVFDACVALLPLATGCSAGIGRDEGGASPRGRLLREILDFVNRHISLAELSPPLVARKFGVSDRYLHKLFAASGMTFGSYVLARRLEAVAGDLISANRRSAPITNLAYDWGFGDISTFNRAFRKRFGCSPSAYRARWGC